jgi:hypothetical protein
MGIIYRCLKPTHRNIGDFMTILHYIPCVDRLGAADRKWKYPWGQVFPQWLPRRDHAMPDM